MELIDFEKKGNVARLYFGKNGEQKGDDWDDRPYECNAGTVYEEFVESMVDLFFLIDVRVEEPADNHLNSEYCKNDFINKKSWVLWIQDDWGCDKGRKPVGVWLGDTLEEIKVKLKDYKALFAEVEAA